MKVWQRNALVAMILSVTLAPQHCLAEDLYNSLSPTAREVSKDIGVSNYIKDLEALRAKSLNPDAIKLDVQFLFVKQQMTEILLTTFLETRDVVSDVDTEMSQSSELKDLLESRRDRAIRLNNITNFTSGGALAMIGSGIQIGGGAAINNAGNVMEVAAGAVATGISTYALKQSNGEKRSAGVNPNMLARIFNLPSGKDKDFPTPIWNFLNEPIPGGKGESRRDLLIERWVQLGRIPPPSSKAGQRRIALLAGTVAQTHAVTIDLLDDRVAMLNDMRAAVGSMSRELLEIMKVMRKL
ncbi:MAG: hypothetical protein HYX67_12580 [Candidatus Melainabacteria bacterium]|nr:hypothetical protein [Candidatus Melainabacteria bacterium]